MKSILKQILSLTLALMLMLASLPFFTVHALAAEYWEGWAELPTTAGGTLSENYKVTSNKTITNSTSGGNGLIISGTVTIYIQSGYTLTVNGANGSGTTGGGAGIYLPTGAKLIIRGGGTLNATGGKGGNGTTGGNGTSASASGSTVSDQMRNITIGRGGLGGNGGGGAGAGIGGSGGSGGGGGARPASVTASVLSYPNRSGETGNSGSNGSGGAACGTLYILDTVKVNATGGVNGTQGSGGSGGSSISGYHYQSTGIYYGSSGGAGGAGGGYGVRAANIGGGGGGGGGGGSGGNGTLALTNSAYGNYSSVSATGGSGGAPYGAKGNMGYSSTNWANYGNDGGSSTGGSAVSGYYMNDSNVISYGAFSGGGGGKGGNVGAGGSGGIVYVASTATCTTPSGGSTGNGEGAAASKSTPTTYTIAYNANGGSLGSVPLTQTKYSGVTEYITDKTPAARAGYTYVGWNTSSSATTANYAANSAYSSNSALTLYAIWAINSYTLTIDYKGGEDETEQIIKEYDTQYIITDPRRDGYVFDGWTLTGGGTVADNGNGTYTYTFADSDGTITAQWILTRQTEVKNETGNNSFNIKQSNLDSVIESVVKPEERDSVVSLTLNVTDNADPSEVEAIKTAASSGSEVYFFDATLTKTVDGVGTETLSNVSVPVEIHIKLEGELAGKTYYRVYRYHDGKAEQISSDTSRAEHYTVDVSASEIIIRTMKFSTYAIFGNDAPIDLGTGYDVDVQAKITGTGGAVYKIDIAWGAMTFEYSNSGVWDADTHSYNTSETVGWLKEGFMNGNNQITAWNHSNGDVNVSFEITQPVLTGVTMEINDSNVLNGTAAVDMPLGRVPNEGESAKSIDAFLLLDGEPINVASALNANYSKIAVITVTIEADVNSQLTPKMP